MDAELYVLALLPLCHNSPIHEPSQQGTNKSTFSITVKYKPNLYLKFYIHYTQWPEGTKQCVAATLWVLLQKTITTPEPNKKSIGWTVDELSYFPNKNTSSYRYKKSHTMVTTTS